MNSIGIILGGMKKITRLLDWRQDAIGRNTVSKKLTYKLWK